MTRPWAAWSKGRLQALVELQQLVALQQLVLVPLPVAATGGVALATFLAALAYRSVSGSVERAKLPPWTTRRGPGW